MQPDEQVGDYDATWGPNLSAETELILVKLHILGWVLQQNS